MTQGPDKPETNSGAHAPPPIDPTAPLQSEGQRLQTSFSIMAILPDPATALPALRGIEALGRLIPAAKLSAIHVEVDPRRYGADPEEIDLQLFRSLNEGTAGERAAAVRRVFDTWWHESGAIGARTAWRKLIGPEESTIVEATKDIDLVILAKPRSLDGSDAFHAAVFSHHLVLVVPQAWSAGTPTFGRHIAIGWKPTREVDQAILLALPLLHVAERISLLAVDQGDATYSHDHVLRALQEFGIDPQLHLANSVSGDVGATLLNEARRIGADSLIAGAFRHGDMWHQIAGGITQDLIAEATIPVFLAH